MLKGAETLKEMQRRPPVFQKFYVALILNSSLPYRSGNLIHCVISLKNMLD